MRKLHRALERFIIKRSSRVVVFNRAYAALVRQVNPNTIFSPTWFDPALVPSTLPIRDPFKVLWVGRLEEPKDPLLGVEVARELVALNTSSPWHLQFVGSGTLDGSLRELCQGLAPDVRDRIKIAGRLEPAEVAETMASSGIFLMTSWPGYEGYPRVLVEAMASGLIPIVTEGSDTGQLVVDNKRVRYKPRSCRDRRVHSDEHEHIS